jgi:putative SOS response-associated peptidase YedK
MCGRFTQTISRKEKLDALSNIELPQLFTRRYNIAPTQTVAVITAETPDDITESIWGFSFTQMAVPIINAKIETLREKQTFRPLLEKNRCLILADGYYEWQDKQPFYLQLPDQKLFGFAGLWRVSPTNPEERECVIITRTPNEIVKPIHDRMPVILPADKWADWLVRGLTPQPPPALTMRPVSTLVNKIHNDSPACIQNAPVQTDLFNDLTTN